jgi:hypothetical protein
MVRIKESKIKERYPKTRKVLEQCMKVVQRELEDGRLKVDLLSGLLELKERLDGKERTSKGLN